MEVCFEELTEGWCEVVGDNVICHSGHWITVCYDVEICTPIDDEPVCDYSLEESCDCQLYNIGCGGDDPPPGGGDEPPEQPVAASFNFENVFAEKHSGSTGTNEDWTLEKDVTINGMKFLSNPADNYYTGFVEDDTPYYINNNPAYGGINGNPMSFVYCYTLPGTRFSSSSLIENDKKFTNTSSAIVHYPNFRNQQGQITPLSFPYSKTKSATAFSDL